MPLERRSDPRQFASPLSRSTNMESLSIPSARPRTTRQPRPSGPLKIPSLPRFHPANFPSQHSSLANTPSPGAGSPQPLMSPRAQQRQFNEAQKHLLAYQREVLASAARKAPSSTKPISPRLLPLAGSPGPVTPLELEAEGYLMVGSPGLDEGAQRDYLERVIRNETTRQRGDLSPRRPTSVGGC